MTGQEVAQVPPERALIARIRRDDFTEQLALALPEHIPPARFVRAAATALLTDPDIARATDASIFRALLTCASDGLMPDAREAALVVYNVKGTPTASYLPMIGGYRKIAADHGWTLTARVVYEADEFDYAEGLEPYLTHKPAPLGSNRGDMIAAYATARKRGEAPIFLVMNAEEIEKVRQTSKAADKQWWKNWPERMWEKTPARRLFKTLPLGEQDAERVRRLIDFDGMPPAELHELVYGRPQRALPAAPVAGDKTGNEAPLAAAAASDPPGEAAAATQPAAASPPAFEGGEPEPPSDPGPGEYVLPDEFRDSGPRGAVYAGKPLAVIVEEGDVDFLAWLASDAIQDTELRGAAAALLAEQKE